MSMKNISAGSVNSVNSVGSAVHVANASYFTDGRVDTGVPLGGLLDHEYIDLAGLDDDEYIDVNGVYRVKDCCVNDTKQV